MTAVTENKQTNTQTNKKKQPPPLPQIPCTSTHKKKDVVNIPPPPSPLPPPHHSTQLLSSWRFTSLRPQAGHLSRRSISLDCCFVMSLEFVASAEVDMRMRISIPHEPAAGNNSCLCSCAFLGWFFFSHCSPSGVYGYRIFHSTSARGPASTCTHFAAHTHTHTTHSLSLPLAPGAWAPLGYFFKKPVVCCNLALSIKKAEL